MYSYRYLSAIYVKSNLLCVFTGSNRASTTRGVVSIITCTDNDIQNCSYLSPSVALIYTYTDFNNDRVSSVPYIAIAIARSPKGK